MKNELGTLISIRNDIQTGYGFSQMLAKEGLTEKELSHLCLTYSDFANDIKNRYGKEYKATKLVRGSKCLKKDT